MYVCARARARVWENTSIYLHVYLVHRRRDGEKREGALLQQPIAFRTKRGTRRTVFYTHLCSRLKSKWHKYVAVIARFRFYYDKVYANNACLSSEIKHYTHKTALYSIRTKTFKLNYYSVQLLQGTITFCFFFYSYFVIKSALSSRRFSF